MSRGAAFPFVQILQCLKRYYYSNKRVLVDGKTGPSLKTFATFSNQTNRGEDSETQPEEDILGLNVAFRVSRPEPPPPESCCGNGCPDCVWTVYLQQLEEFEEQRKRENLTSPNVSKSKGGNEICKVER